MINNVVLMGRLTAAPELKATPNGVSVTVFGLAVERNYKGQNGAKQTDFFNCVAWRNTAEFISRYFSKGDMIAVIGEIQTRKYTDSGGNARTAFEVIIDQASFCGNKSTPAQNSETNTRPSGTQSPTLEASYGTANFTEVPKDEDLPF